MAGGVGEGRYAASMSPWNSMFNHGGVPKGTRDSLEPCFSRVFQGGVNQSEASGTSEVSSCGWTVADSTGLALAAGV